jgi:hypothetical protein
MTRRPVTSEVLRSVGYAAASSTLEIEFTTGTVYRYFGVPIAVHTALMEAESHGTYFNENVRDDFACKRVA